MSQHNRFKPWHENRGFLKGEILNYSAGLLYGKLSKLLSDTFHLKQYNYMRYHRTVHHGLINYTDTKAKCIPLYIGGVWRSGHQTEKHLPQSPLQVNFFR